MSFIFKYACFQDKFNFIIKEYDAMVDIVWFLTHKGLSPSCLIKIIQAGRFAVCVFS